MFAIRQSFDRAKEADFARHFYDRLLASDPAIRQKFARTNFEQQRDLLVHGVYSMLDYAEGRALGKLALGRLAARHGPRDLDVPEWMYDRWLSCFIDSLRVCDPTLDEELVAGWVNALRPGIAAMKAASRASSADGPAG